MNEEINKLIESQAPARRREIQIVKNLGEQIGYGNLMDIASVLWAIKLNEDYGVTSGAFVPTITGFMKKREAEKAEKKRERKMQIYKERYL